MKTYIYLILLFCFGISKISAQTTEKENGNDNYFIKSIYEVETKKSEINFVEKDTFFKSIIGDSDFSKFFNKNKHNPMVYYSSLVKFKLKKNKFIFNRIKNKYEPDYILNKFIAKNLESNSFENCNDCKLGVFFYYNAENYEFFAELVEIKNKKYYSIHSEKIKVFDEPIIIKHQCKPIKEN